MLKFALLTAAIGSATFGYSQVESLSETFPPEGSSLNGKLIGGIRHGTESWDSVDLSSFSASQDLRKGWDGTIKGRALGHYFETGDKPTAEQFSYSIDLKYASSDGTSDTWDIVGGLISFGPAGPPVEYVFRQDFGQVKADRHDVKAIRPDILSYTITATFDADEFASADGGSTYSATGDQFHFDLQPAPEPTSLLALGLGVAGMLRRRAGRK